MRYMMIMNVDAAIAAGPQPVDMAEAVETMGRYNEEMQKAGVFLGAEGLAGADEGFRVDFESGPPVVTDGPFAEAAEVFTGFWILEVAGRDEAEYWARKCPLGPGSRLEVRRIGELSDFDELGPDNEWVKKVTEWRAAHE
jgi:hypothetical protein